jgi:hypothetical protein
MIAMQWRLAALTSVCNTVGDVLNTAGMKREPEVEKLNLHSLIAMLSRIVRNWVRRRWSGVVWTVIVPMEKLSFM